MPSTPLETYSDAVDYLYSYVNWEIERHVRYAPETMTLERPRAVLAAFGNPQARYPTVHVTGTKGKGSVSAMCAAAFEASGLRTGFYSSPHLQDFRERFRIDNQLIAPEDFTALMNQLRPVIETIPNITWFEVTTALAFLYFAQKKVDVAVIEVGLGGRLDATNVIRPVVSVITSLSYDHTYLLGDTLASIAREKGGIIKPGIPVVSAPQPPEALEILAEIAAGRGAPLTLVGDDWLYTLEGTTWNGEQFLAGPVGEPPELYRTALAGEHQALNATVALAALDHARRAGVPVSPEGIRAGFEHVDWPGRLEIVNYSPLLVLDAAHNGESARRLATALDEMFPQRPRALIFGASADKDVAGMFEALLPHIDFLIAAQAVHPRALDPDTIESTARQAGFRGPVYEIPDVQSALQRAAELVGPSGLICTTGSVFIVGEMRTVCGLPVGHVLPVVQPPATATGSPS
jgi:dihydrofolate synthase/folylpolyglutamate synthase